MLVAVVMVMLGWCLLEVLVVLMILLVVVVVV